MKVDKNTGLVEMIMDKLEEKDEGTYTFQLQDGKATNQSSLVLIGDGRLIYTMQWAEKIIPRLPQLSSSLFTVFNTNRHSMFFLCHSFACLLQTGHVCELKFLK